MLTTSYKKSLSVGFVVCKSTIPLLWIPFSYSNDIIVTLQYKLCPQVASIMISFGLKKSTTSQTILLVFHTFVLYNIWAISIVIM